MKIDLWRLKILQKVKNALLAAMFVLIMLSLYQALVIVSENIQKLDTWLRQPALVISLAHEDAIEVEVTRTFVESLSRKQTPEFCSTIEAEKTCLIVPRAPYAWISVFDEVDLLQNPELADDLVILSHSGLWLPVLGYALSALLLAWLWRRFKNSGLGEDRTWFNGSWMPSQQAPVRIGFGAPDSEPIRELRIDKTNMKIWGFVFLLIAIITLPGALMNLSSNPVQAMLVIVLVLGFFFLMLYAGLANSTRIVYQDQNGLIDSNLFGVKRLPWREIGQVELVNLNQQSQSRYSSFRSGSGKRPENLYVYVVSDHQGRKILHLSHHMEPTDAFQNLLSRLQSYCKDDGRKPNKSQAELSQEWHNMAERMSAQPKGLFHPSRRGLLITLTLMLLPFVLGTAYMVYQSLWFIYGAERTQGRIIEIKHEGLPSLVIKYETPLGKALRLESDGSESYASFNTGDELTVYYKAENPENARLDLFADLWLWPIVMAVLTSIVALIVVLIGKAMTKPMPGMG